MPIRFASLGSGSKGNSTVFDDGTTRLLIDLGFSLREALARLAKLNLSPEEIDCILVTHEHADHVHGVGAFEPVPQELPAGHGLHSAAEVRSVALENEPARHGSTALAPAGQ